MAEPLIAITALRHAYLPGTPMRTDALKEVDFGLHEGEIVALIGVLATIGSTAPFVGLFGTTIGIINAFTGMKTEETAGIAAVAGGIAEALVTTAFGLFVAVPAVWAYNAFTNRVETFTVEMDNSSSELIDYFLKRRSETRG